MPLASFPVTIQLESDPDQVLTLTGSSAPEGELELERVLNVVRTYYPGNSEPSVQILNIEEKPFKLKGLFSDRETQVAGYREAMRDSLIFLFRRMEPVMFSYRDYRFRMIMTRAIAREINLHEIGYEIELSPIPAPSKARFLASTGNARRMTAEIMAARLQEMVIAWDEAPMRQLPAGSLVTEADLAEPERIPPAAFEQDPWLLLRINMEETIRRARQIMELAGASEEVQNASDRAVWIARMGWLAASRAREALSGWNGGSGGLVEQLAEASGVQSLYDAVGNVRTLLRF